jgi:hypothetical protein
VVHCLSVVYNLLSHIVLPVQERQRPKDGQGELSRIPWSRNTGIRREDEMDVTSEVAIVTGEGRGSGQGIALALAENGPRHEWRNNAKATVNLQQRR